MPELKVTTKRTPSSGGISVYGVPPGASAGASSTGVYISGDYYKNDIIGKPYPGRINYLDQRQLAYTSTVVRAIISLRTQQVAMLPFKIVPKNEDEPTRKISIFDYNLYEITYHPAFDDAEKSFLKKKYLMLDPDAYKINKQPLFEDEKDNFSDAELATIEYLQDKHDEFYNGRDRDTKRIRELLECPDPYFSETRSWSQLVQAILFDLIALDRGAMVKLRDTNGELRGLLPADGTTLRPLINEFGFYDEDKAYVQVSEKGGVANVYLSKKDVIIMSMNRVTDLRYFGYGVSPMETLYTAAMADIYIDKGQLDFYRKGGSLPEGFLNLEPPTSREGTISQMSQENIEYMQRNLQALMSGDYTQLPIFSGGKATFVDFKGKRRDMQYQELANYMARKICAVLQVSPIDVGITSDVNRSSSETQKSLSKSKGLLPLMNTVSEYITRDVLDEMRPEKDLKLVFEEEDDEKARNEWTMQQQQLISGVMTVNEFRIKKGLPPVPWGNSPMLGLRNWRDEREEEQQAGGPGGGLPPLPGMPPMAPPGMMNPGGPVGGANPGAGRPPAGALKSSRFFSLRARDEDEAEDLMVKGFADMYMESSNFREVLSLHDIHNYPGGEWLRSPVESYRHFVDTNPSLGITLDIPENTDTRDVLLLSSSTDDGIHVTGGNLPLIKVMAREAYKSLPTEKRDAVDNVTDGRGTEALERFIYKRLDTPLQEALHKDFYRFKSFSVTDAQLEEVEACIDSQS